MKFCTTQEKGVKVVKESKTVCPVLINLDSFVQT